MTPEFSGNKIKIHIVCGAALTMFAMPIELQASDNGASFNLKALQERDPVGSGQASLDPPDVSMIDENGVDLTDATAVFSLQAGSIGAVPTSIEYRLFWSAQENLPVAQMDSLFTSMYRYTDDLDLSINAILYIKGKAVKFSRFPNGFQNGSQTYGPYYRVHGPYATLIESADGKRFTYRERDGTSVTYGIPVGMNENVFCHSNSIADGGGRCGLLGLNLTSPSGYNLKYEWSLTNNVASLTRVASNLGYAAAYSSNGNTTTINLYNYAYSLSPVASIKTEVSNGRKYITTAGGDLWQVYSTATTGVEAIRRPGSASDSQTYRIESTNGPDLKLSMSRNGIITSYYLMVSGQTKTMRITKPSGATKIVSMYYANSRTDKSSFPKSIQDETGGITQYEFTPNYIVTSVTRPEGDRTEYYYDDRDNIVKMSRVAKSGSGTPTTSDTYSFPSDCANVLTCNKPSYRVDPRGNKWEYSYDPNNGYVTAYTGPPVDGVRPQVRYVYVQRYAWYRVSSGTITRSESPVWLLSKESRCKTSNWNGTTCTKGSSDEVVTNYDYGPDGVASNLNVLGIAVSDGGLVRRTCYTYDRLGNKTAEIQPNANLSSCP